jgi:hypothetical protein
MFYLRYRMLLAQGAGSLSYLYIGMVSVIYQSGLYSPVKFLGTKSTVPLP